MTIDVVMPLYNKRPFVERAILSVLQQTLPPSRLLIVDDGSNDGSMDVAQQLASAHPSIMVLHTPAARSGPSVARNIGLEYCRSEFVAFLDADDWWAKEKLERQVRLFEEHSEVGVTHTGCAIVAPDGKVLGTQVPTAPSPDPAEFFNQVRLEAYAVTGSSSSVVVRRHLLESRNLEFPEQLLYGEDYLLWCQLARVTKFASIPDLLVFITELPDSLSRRPKTPSEIFSARLRMMDAWAADPDFLNAALPALREEAHYWQFFTLLQSPIALLSEFPKRIRAEGGRIGRMIYPTGISYYASLLGLPMSLVRKLARRISSDDRA